MNEPILVYQMGKVASSTVYGSIKGVAASEVHHVHRLVRSNIERIETEHHRRGWTPPSGPPEIAALLEFIATRQPAKVITLVRDPIARNISYYFHNLDKILSRERAHELPIETILHGFTERFPYSDDPLTWFDYEFNVALDTDVYGSGFRAGMRAHRWQAGPYDILLLRADAPDEAKCEAVRSFLGLEQLTLTSTNLAEEKPVADAYRAFREVVKFTPDYVDRMLESRVARFFFDDDSRSRWRAQYLSGGSIVPRDLQTNTRHVI
jgi:hypothetical protein